MVMSVAQAVPLPAKAQPRDAVAGLPAYAVDGEVVHFDFRGSARDKAESTDHPGTPNTLQGGPDGYHHNGAYADFAENWWIWGNPDAVQDGRTLRLDGSNQYVSVPLTLPTDQSFTVSSWVQVTKGGQPYGVISQDGGRVSGFFLKLNPDGKPEFGMPRADDEKAGWDTVVGKDLVTPFQQGVMKPDWTHLTGVFDAQAHEVRLYVNGVLVGRAPHTATWKAAGQVELGRDLWAGKAGDYLPGGMANVRIWQRPLADAEVANVAVPDAVVRDDRCKLGNWLHAGGPKAKGLIAQALNGTGSDIVWNSLNVFGLGPVPQAMGQDETDQRAANNAQNDRVQAWSAAAAPFREDILRNGGSATLQSAPDLAGPVQKFLLEDVKPDWNGPSVPKPGKAALDTAKALFDKLADNPYHMLGVGNGKVWTRDALDSLSSYQIARFIKFGGFPTTAPAKDSVEFRTEVEDLKVQWAACDGSNPPDPNGVFGDVTATADTEWQAELAAQAKQRADIAAADIQAYQDVRTASNAMIDAQGQAYVISQLLAFQKYWAGQPKSGMFYPKPEKFTQATAAMATAKKAITGQLAVAQKAAASAKAQADKATAAEADAGKIALANGTPYGRGLAYALQSAQVTKASAAAAQSAAKAIETTQNTASATQADSKALYALGDAQTHAAQAEFQRAAAQEAADQAHNAAVAAANQADQAKQAAARAKADREQAQQAEATAKAAAADAHQQRQIADQEQANAAAARAKADAERAKAADAEAQAKQQQAAADAALGAAQTAGATATAKEAAAEEAESNAAIARDAAVTAEQNRDAATSRQKALEAAAAAAQGTADAQETRQAANDAKTAADQAGTAAAGARSSADQAGQDAIAARSAATEAAGAAARAQAAADKAGSDAATTSAAAATAHSAAADAIAASGQAAQNAANANQQAHVAAAATVKARQAAQATRIAADSTTADSARAAGQAYASALFASAARDAAGAAIAAGNTAIALGTPFRQTDSAAGLAVLIGQAGKSLAQQQADAAKARSDEAAKAAKDAAALAAKANADAKAAAQFAAQAAADTVNAFTSVQQARDYAAQAATEAAGAKTAEADTAEYDRQANLDALAATGSSAQAQTDATAANSAATAAEQNAAAARQAATAAENAAGTARGIATQSDLDATAAEKAAANAQTSAQQANQAATDAEAQERADLEAAMEAQRTAQAADPATSAGTDLSGDDEKLLLAQCGQSCVDDFRNARATAGQDILDWVKQNGGQILLDVLGVTDAKKCFTSGDVESCLWTALNVASLVAVVGKAPAVSKAVIRISEGIGKFFEEAEAAKRTLDRLRKLVEEAKEGKTAVSCLVSAAGLAVPAAQLTVRHAAAAHVAPRAGKPLCMTSVIGEDSLLKKAAEEAGNNQQAQRDIDNMFAQLMEGNMNPGMENKALKGTDISYARARNGGRLFFRNVNGTIQIVGKADKGNEPKVIARLLKLYGK
ncbi:hypothetical protein GCM10009760_24960 [Kitasatospora kazusensis]|uniref:LamG-like jellyroll fold domain-containing protein n=2 Tax=Kitasatospora kazusensis TaxID=407974 RepID=A0ABN2ZEP8_9ACTN